MKRKIYMKTYQTDSWRVQYGLASLMQLIRFQHDSGGFLLCSIFIWNQNPTPKNSILENKCFKSVNQLKIKEEGSTSSGRNFFYVLKLENLVLFKRIALRVRIQRFDSFEEMAFNTKFKSYYLKTIKFDKNILLSSSKRNLIWIKKMKFIMGMQLN